MEDKYLTLEQNICAARVFLNTFGFILEEVENLNEFSKVKIYDKSMDDVGELHFNNGKVMMIAKYRKGTLVANYDIAKIFGFVDIESDNSVFGQWSSKINFEIKNNYAIIDGEFLITCTADTEYGISCRCHPLINYQIPGKGNVTIKILRDGLTFGVEMGYENRNEKIQIRPWDDLNGFLLHNIKHGEYDEKKHSYPYRKYAGIFNGGSSQEYRDKLHVFLKESEYDKCLYYHNEYVTKINKDESSEAVIQKGLLMQKLDNDLIQKINDLRKLFLLDGISLLDNLISVCYDSYTDEELSALLGIKIKRMIYQDWTENLTDSYFGIGTENKFLSLEQQQKLLKK